MGEDGIDGLVNHGSKDMWIVMERSIGSFVDRALQKSPGGDKDVPAGHLGSTAATQLLLGKVVCRGVNLVADPLS